MDGDGEFMLSSRGPLVLGISAYYHDSAAAIASPEGALGAIQEERISRIKGDASFPNRAIEQLLDYLGVDAEEISAVAYYEKPWRKLKRIARTQITQAPRGWKQLVDVFENYKLGQLRIRSQLRQVGLERTPLLRFAHHESHAASTFFASEFESSAILTVDGVGEWTTASISRGTGADLLPVKEMHFPDSVGLLYATMTAYCGFKVNSGEYKLMGLAPYGESKYVNLLREHLVHVFPDGSICLNMDYFGFTRSLSMYGKKLEELLGFPPRKPEAAITGDHCNLAASVQIIVDEIVEKMAKHALEVTGEANLCLAGGVALNCVTNGRLRNSVALERIFIQPAAGDAGGALGAAYLGVRELTGGRCKPIQRGTQASATGAFLGKSSERDEIVRALETEGVVWQNFSEHSKWLEEVVTRLVSGQVVGVFLGRMEFGPRALGARSILADARNAEMQSRLNLKIKQRESFRPFAPMVLFDYAAQWFDWPEGQGSPYMLFVAPVAEGLRTGSGKSLHRNEDLIAWVNEERSLVPAITHVDFSARLQTVERGDPSYDILNGFFQATGVPILVNTSFNVRGEPIVESPSDAIRCFLATEMDCLVFPGVVLDRNEQEPDVILRARRSRVEWALD